MRFATRSWKASGAFRCERPAALLPWRIANSSRGTLDLPDAEEARRHEAEVWQWLQGSRPYMRRVIDESEPDVHIAMSGSFPDTMVTISFHDPLRGKDHRLKFSLWSDEFVPAPGLRFVPQEAAAEISNTVAEGEWRSPF